VASAKKGDTVVIHYTGKFPNETVFDTSQDREPLRFTIGDGKIIQGVEQAVIGMSPGESKIINVAPEEGYGPRRSNLVTTIEKKEFPPNIGLQVGKIISFRHPAGQIIRAEITEITEFQVTLDANHPLAGKDLIFDILLVEIV
jgi:peptidylprolyl isomerase